MNDKKAMKRLLIFCAVLWVAFAATGIAMHEASKGHDRNEFGWVGIAGYDSEAFLSSYIHMEAMFDVGHRHPLRGIAFFPIIAVGVTATDWFGPEVGQRAVLACFALFGVTSFLLLWLVLAKLGAPFVSRVGASALWLSFAYVWILGGIAETFGASMMILLGVTLLVAYGVRDVRAWFAACVVAGGVTVTNGVKPILSWLAAAGGWDYVRKLPRKTVLVFCGVASGLFLAALAFLALKWTFLDGFGFFGGIHSVVSDIGMYLPHGTGFGRRCWLTWNMFWCEPMLLHGKFVGASYVTAAYGKALPHVVGAAVMALCVWSAIANFWRPVVRAALLMVSFDVLLHVVVGWGFEEGYLYCGHWFWIIPLLVGLLPRKMALLTAVLAVCIALHNLLILF